MVQAKIKQLRYSKNHGFHPVRVSLQSIEVLNPQGEGYIFYPSLTIIPGWILKCQVAGYAIIVLGR